MKLARTCALSAALALGCSSADNVDSNEGTEIRSGLVCGLDVLPSPQSLPSTSPCEDGRTIFGPARFEAERGQPRAETVDLSSAVSGDLCITIKASGGALDAKPGQGNGYGWAKKHAPDDWVPGANPMVYFDGARIATPRDFAGSRSHELTLDSSAGTHELQVQVAGAPGAYAEIEVRERMPIDGDTVVDVTNGDGTVRLTDVATDHPLLTPNGDGHHDDTVFTALVEPLQALPGKDDGTVDYFLVWEFIILDLDSCATIDTGITGTTQINSPTLVSTTWDGTDSTGSTLADGTYAYVFDVQVQDEFGADFGSVQSPPLGIIIDSSPADYDEQPNHVGACDPATDPTFCMCPGGGGGATDPNCSFGAVQHLLHEAGFPPGTQPNYYDPSVVDLSFISTTQDATTGRYEVVVDLIDQTGRGLVPKGNGVWEDEQAIRDWVAGMTGVPSSGDSLFNFDFVQIGTSTGVNLLGVSNHSFNHFFLDAITDDDGNITIGTTTTSLASFFGNDSAAPPAYVVDGRVDDECTEGGNTDGTSTVRASLCAYNTAVAVGDSSALGVYDLRAGVFGIEIDGATTTSDELCVTNGIFSCGIRTQRVPADNIAVESSYYDDDAGLSSLSRVVVTEVSDVDALTVSADRSSGHDGVCARAVATHGGLAVRMNSADGSVPDTCVTNGIF